MRGGAVVCIGSLSRGGQNGVCRMLPPWGTGWSGGSGVTSLDSTGRARHSLPRPPPPSHRLHTSENDRSPTPAQVFGGWLMRRAFETAFICGWEATGALPKFLALDDVTFLRPVEVRRCWVCSTCASAAERWRSSGRGRAAAEWSCGHELVYTDGCGTYGANESSPRSVGPVSPPHTRVSAYCHCAT